MWCGCSTRDRFNIRSPVIMNASNLGCETRGLAPSSNASQLSPDATPDPLLDELLDELLFEFELLDGGVDL